LGFPELHIQMELQFDITRRFEADLKRLSAQDQARVGASINKYAGSYAMERGDPTHHIYQPHKIMLSDGLDSSLYILRATGQIRVILTIEADPIFGKNVVTLLRAVRHDALDEAFRSIEDALYQHWKSGEARKIG
jgi:mRNA-degrading endonuclease RelE of RelBE toxin-antitoxin system